MSPYVFPQLADFPVPVKYQFQNVKAHQVPPPPLVTKVHHPLCLQDKQFSSLALACPL